MTRPVTPMVDTDGDRDGDVSGSTSVPANRPESEADRVDADQRGVDMNDELDQSNSDQVERDGLAMLAVLVLAIVLIVYVGYNVI